MAAAVLAPSNVSGPFTMAHHQHQRVAAPSSPPIPSSSRTKQPTSSSNVTSSSAAPESSSKPFNRIRSSLEQSLRNATRSKKQPTPLAHDFDTITPKNNKGKEKDVGEGKERPGSGMLRRLESKVNFRRSGRESVTPSPSPIPPPIAVSKSKDHKNEKPRLAGHTSYITPSLRQGSMSSPALHLSSQPMPSPKSRSAIPASSSSNSDALVSPTRERPRRSSMQPPQRDIFTPTRIESRGNGHVPSGTREPTSRHRSTKSQPLNLPSSSSAQSLLTTNHNNLPPPETPRRRTREPTSPPDTPTPLAGSRVQLARTSSRTAPSAAHLNSPPPSPSPITPRGTSPSPIRPRSPSSRTRHISAPRGLSSSSASHLPITPISPSPTPRRPSIDSPRRPTFGGAALGRDETPSPTPRPRPISPTQRSYAHNRHYNISTASLTSPTNPEHRELIRTATSMLCKEIVKPPPHMSRTESGLRDWEEVEVRTRALARLERIWGRSGISDSTTSLHNAPGMGASGLSASGEERERRLFCEALRDGFVLCQLMNKLRSSSIVKPDSRDDGFVRTANVTKFLAACSSYGLSNEDLFQRDDLIEGTGESLARVAKTIIALIKFVDAPVADRSRYVTGQAKNSGSSPTSPYPQGTSSRAAASTPNLVQRPMASPVPPPTPPPRKRWPAAGPLTVRTDSPDDSKGGRITDDVKVQGTIQVDDDDRSGKSTPKIAVPPPRSPLRARAPKPQPLTFSNEDDDPTLFTWAMNRPPPPPRPSDADSTRASVGDLSMRESINVNDHTVRQSVASTAMTDTTTTTLMSSLMDVGRASSSNKFGTIRTINTEATSEAPSIGRAEGNSFVDELARKRASDPALRDRKLNDVSVVDLSRVVEEAEESGSSSRGNARDKRRATVEEETQKAERSPAIRLGKGKWPDDFLDALQTHNKPRPIPIKATFTDSEEHLRSSSPISISPPRKLAIVGRRNESLESIPPFPRRPTHRPRHSIDAPGSILPKDTARLRDPSPDGLPAAPSRVMLRRHSTKPIPHRNGLLPRGSFDEPRVSDTDTPVPFPRTDSGSPSRTSSGEDRAESSDKPRPPRGRFQSDVEGSRRRPRPSSYDDLGAKPAARTRYESMVNLGAPSGNTSASDLMSRDSIDGSAVRKTLIVREEGKPPTHFQLGNCIGRGQFGSVYRALNLNTGQMVAVKRIRLEGLKEEEVTTLMREVDLVKSLSHPSIVKYEGMARDENTLSIVLEYAENGSLGQTLKAFGKLNERLVASYVVKILEGLHYLHRCDVVHCDLKAANILTTKNGNVKLSDFGVSLNLRAMEREIKDVAGTPNWMAPEVIELKGASTKSDIWSLACTVIELLTGKPPYADIANSMSVMFRIVEDDMPPIPEGCSPLLENFLTQCFDKDPSMRPDADVLCEHPWLKKNWGAHKELRPQDSIPFLRRVSADLQKSEAVRYLSQLEMPESPTREHTHRVDDMVSGTPPGRRMSNSSLRPLGDNDISPREHSFVKTTFSKPMVCRVCRLHVKKSAVLCAQCSLIAHSKCAVNAPPTCDLRAQLLLYAQYAEKGNPASAYSNPLDTLNEAFPKSPMSDVPYVAHSPRTSIDTPRPLPHQHQTAPAPDSPDRGPGAFKFMAAFKRSRSNLSADPEEPSSSRVSLPQERERKEKSKAPPHRIRKERPPSVTSNSTNANSSLRSGVTAMESAGRKSVLSTADTETGMPLSPIGESGAIGLRNALSTSGTSDADGHGSEARVPGHLATEPRRQSHKKDKSSNSNCAVQ